MSLNNISLTPQLLADLYSNVIIESQTTSIKQEASEKKEALKFLGNNKKNILILVSKENVAFLEETELNFLSSILMACKLSIADVAIVNLKNVSSDAHYQTLTDELKTKTVLLFDVNTETIDLPFKFPHFQLQQFDKCIYLSAPSLKEIEDTKTLKTQLWNCLKKIFSL